MGRRRITSGQVQKDHPQFEALRKQIVDAFSEETGRVADLLVETAEEQITNALRDAVRDAIGMEYDDWRNHWRLSTGSDWQDRWPISHSMVIDAAKQTLDRLMKGEKIEFTAAELEQVRKAYRRAYVSATVELARTAGAVHAAQVVSDATGVELDEGDAMEAIQDDEERRRRNRY